MNIFSKISIYTLAPIFFFNCYSIASVLPPCYKSENSRHLCYGTQFYSGGGKYTGEWVDLKANGRGVYTFSNRNISIS